jgi:hypothetical protein
MDVTKSLTSLAETIEKASISSVQNTGWARDLNSPEFMSGRRVAADFEVGLPKRG